MKHDENYVRQLEKKNQELYSEIERIKKAKATSVAEEVVKENEKLNARVQNLESKLAQIEEICFEDVFESEANHENNHS